MTSTTAPPRPPETATAELQSAIDAAVAAGGGRVVVTPGTHLVGSLQLGSHVELHLEAGARLVFVPDPALYPLVDARWEGVRRQVHRPCLWAHGAEGVAITGHGTIDGGGQPWWDAARSGAAGLAPRPTLIGLHECTAVTIRDVRLRNSPSWTVHPLLCSDVTITGVGILNPADSPNTDGINPESSRNVRISDCHIDVGDDCIAIKAGTEGTHLPGACENITISNCTMVHGHGGVVIGSEMSGDVRNVVISTCVFQGTDRGLRIKTRRGRGGTVEDIRMTNVVMDHVVCPFEINPFYHCGPDGRGAHVADRSVREVGPGTPTLRRIHVAHVSARNVHAAAGFVFGLPEQPLSELSLRDVTISFARDAVPGIAAMADGVGPTARAGLSIGHVVSGELAHVRVQGADGPGLIAEHSPRLQLRHNDLAGVITDGDDRAR